MFKLLKLLILLVVLVGAGVMFLPLGSVDYKDPNMAGNLVVPSFSMFEGEMLNASGEYVATFQTVRSEWALEREFERMLSEKYVEKTCGDGEVGYVDEANRVVVRGYTIDGGIPFSKYSVTYDMRACE